MIAACRLQALIDSRAGQPDIAKIMVQVTHIIEAVKSTVPRELWGEIRRKLDQLEKHPGSPDGETETYQIELSDVVVGFDDPSLLRERPSRWWRV
jgi:hypothetical protein